MPDDGKRRGRGIQAPIEVSPAGGKKSLHALRPVIAREGIRMFATEGLSVGTEVTMTIFFTDRSGEKAPEAVPGIVASSMQDGNFYELFLEFKAINQQDQPQLSAFLDAIDQYG